MGWIVLFKAHTKTMILRGNAKRDDTGIVAFMQQYKEMCGIYATVHGRGGLV